MNYFMATYDTGLVALSLVVATLASLTALDLAGRVRVSTGVAGMLWLVGGAFAMGTGIWAMHFIGMLAMEATMHAGYSLGLTAVSLVAAILASALALYIVQTGRLNRYRLGAGSVVMAMGVCLMHYVGMEAMLTGSTIRYQPGLFMASVIIAVSAAGLSLWMAFFFTPANGRPPFWQRLCAALIMAAGISGMHYTGMAAAIMPDSGMTVMQHGITSVQLAVAIALIATCILLAAMIISLYDAHLSSHNARLATSLRQANLELKNMVYRDPLTQLPNRLLLEERLDTLLPDTVGLAILFINLDRFRTINDTFGHHAGDGIIQSVAHRLQAAAQEADIVARVGGDEFMMVISESVHPEGYLAFAQHLMDSLGRPFQFKETVIEISASIGISLYPGQAIDRHTLMVYADIAMNSARDSGGNRFKLYETGMFHLVDRRSAIERRLRQALENNTLSLAYQPKVGIRSGAVEGVEALLRWDDDELGRITPDEIIPIAEATGLIQPLGEWVLRTACAFFGRGCTLGYPMSVAVNVSALQLNDRHFSHQVMQILHETGLPAERLELELTESALVHNPEQALTTLVNLRALGLSLAIDDFGTGYSNLAQLRRFPIQTLKIDRTFMASVTESPQEAAIVRAVMALAHSLDLHVVAEGIETREQLEFIRHLGGHQYQGYLCSPAMPSHHLGQFIEAYHSRDSYIPDPAGNQ